VFGSPRIELLGRPPFALLSLGFLVFAFLLVSNVQAQQPSIPGLQAPIEKSSAVKELPFSFRAARGEAPLSRLYDYVKVEQFKLRRLPALKSEEAKEQSAKKVRIGTIRLFSRPVDLESDSARYEVAEGAVRVMGIVSEGAAYTRIHFSQMSLPAGARVFVYSLKNPDDFQGPYENNGPSADGTFWTPPLEGDAVAIEYFTPGGTSDPNAAPFHVSEISHIYRSLLAGTGQDAAGACNLEVTSDWAQVAKSVGYLTFATSGGEFACTGTLLNNPSNDQTPFLLTANHCFNTQTEAQSLRVWWNYNTGESPTLPVTDGANLLATGTSSDYTLVRLTGTLPSGLFFAGWDANSTPVGTAVTGIHHPENSHKRIAFGTTNANCIGGLPGPCANYTHVRWNSGTTEPGSSGSGLWKGSATNAQLVGSLTGGEAACNNLTGTDEYGSFSVTYPNIASFLTGTTPTVKLSANNYNIQESGGHVTLTVNRSTSVGTATVDYATSDSAGLLPCSQVSTLASSRCDYASTIGTLRFAAGETSKSIFIPIVDDSYSEGPVETFTLTLSNPTGAVLGSPATATITIQDDALPTSNPITNTAFFIREHYIDFLGREPDPVGYQGWQNILNNCPPSGKDTNGNYCDRIEVSSAFFRSEEFQSRGYFAYRFYPTMGKIPIYGEFMPDLAKLSGFLSAAELEANKVALTNEVMNRQEFKNRYDALTTPTAYVDGLLQTVGLPTHPSRAGWIAGLTNSSLTRAQVLRQLVDSAELSQKYYNQAFVIMQYFGYLRRTADASYTQWIQTMNTNGGDYRVMINGFMNSAEYRQRFGP
jgi:hypothetical protein